MPLDRLALFRHPDRAHAPFADLLQQLVAAGDDGAGLFEPGRFGRRDSGLAWARRHGCGGPRFGGRPIQKAPRLGMVLQQCLDRLP